MVTFRLCFLLPEPDRPYSEAFDSGIKMAMVFIGIGMLYDAGKSICSVIVAETTQQNRTPWGSETAVRIDNIDDIAQYGKSLGKDGQLFLTSKDVLKRVGFNENR
jgi:hypothetical protein